jgi:AcrR family transcriptional regulator
MQPQPQTRSDRETRKKPMASDAPKRLPPALRKAAILSAAMNLLKREGLEGFSLEAVARDAGVAATLPRHYFGSSSDLLKAATKDVLKEVEHVLLDRDLHLKLESRLGAYLEILRKHPWGHEVWVRAGNLHTDIDTVVRRARRRMAEARYTRPWKELTAREQYFALGQIGFIEAVVSEWIKRGMTDTEVVIRTLLAAFRQMPG